MSTRYAFANARCGAVVQVTDDEQLDVRFGPLRIATPLDNVAVADVTGPYVVRRTLGVRCPWPTAG